MLREITLEPTTYNLCPSSGYEEIMQNIKCLLLTAKGTCFFYRDFGVSTELLDKPLNVAQQKFLAEVVRQVNRFEPRAKVRRIRWQGDGADGTLKPIILLEVQT